MTGSQIIVKPVIAEQFEAFLKQGRVFFFGAPCGFGKSALAEALLAGKPVVRCSAADPGFVLPRREDKWSILLLDDLQCIQEESDWQALCELIRSSPQRRFVLLSRAAPPGCLMAFQYTGLMTVVDGDALLFDREDIRRCFHACGVEATDSEINGTLKESSGYPLGVAITARCMAAGKPYGAELTAQAFREVFFYFESAIYQRFDLPLRNFLLELASFESFDLEMARVVSGDPHAGELIDWLQRHTSMLRYDGVSRFRFWPQFRAFLLWEMEREYSEEKRRALFSRGGLYYELQEDYPHALDCYAKGGDHSKVSEMLTRNSELHPGMGHYYEMEKYYRALPEQEILASPSLMQGMSMLCSLATDYDGSERWYEELRQFAQRRSREDAAGRQARSRLAWLDISLPQRGVEGLTETFAAAFRLMMNKEISLPPFSVTSMLPSVMNGGKDFSEWSKKDDLLYRTLRIPVETVLGRDGVGLADCAIAESKFEKGEDVSSRMLTLISRMNDIQRDGTPDIEFAAAGLLARAQIAAGRAEDARHIVETLRTQFADTSLTRFLPNMDAMLCRISLYTGDMDKADVWYREKALRDPVHINVMRRYQYVTQAMVEVANGRYDAALVTLAPLEPYCRSCRRHIDGIHLDVLSAIALYRRKDAAWEKHLSAALSAAEEYRFIRTISGYGASILPLLEDFYWNGSSAWFKRLMSDVRMQASYYPAFLKPRLALGESLTSTELQVLRLICADKSNAEIGQIMDIKLPTVKTHVSHILDKLGVNRRSEAKTAAKKLWLVPEER